jgi:hypothetical protein
MWSIGIKQYLMVRNIITYAERIRADAAVDT